MSAEKPPPRGAAKMPKGEIKPDSARSLSKLGYLYSIPMGVWFTILFVLPLLIIAVYSVLQRGLYGGVERIFSLQAYSEMLNPKYARVVLRTVEVAFFATVFSMLLALPCGYAMARSKNQTLYLILIMIPFWINSLIRIFGWMSILGNDGYLNTILRSLGFISDYAQFLYNKNAVILVSVYMYLPYAVLPIFTAIDRFDFSLLEAARDLGCTKPGAMFRILLPSIRSGIFTAVIFTFIPVFGAYTVPLLVGGMDSYMLGNIIVDQMMTMHNWPLASAFSMVITLVSTALVVWMLVAGRTEKNEKNARKSAKAA
ncbi:MAG: ABC transporter permease [Treponemataceae bacterium]|nr:MAG: ABC transporter permease [Treponemataceae bacterium]